jgi:hypothetical protein
VTDCNKEPEVGTILELDVDMSVELVIVITGADIGILFDTGANVVVVSGTGLNTSSGTNVGFMSGTLIVVGIVICCRLDSG